MMFFSLLCCAFVLYSLFCDVILAATLTRWWSCFSLSRPHHRNERLTQHVFFFFSDQQQQQDFPKKDAAIAAGFKEKDVAKVFKEGGKKGVEIEGAADMSGLTCFCTRIQNAKGEVKLLEVAMEGMNAIPDPSDEEERKGCSGKISKIIISESEEKGQIAMVAYVAEETKDKLNAKDWLQGVCDSDLGGGVGGTVDEGATDTWATVTCKEDKEKFFFLKMKDNCLGAAIAYLRERDLFQDDSSSEEGDNPAADFEW